MASLEQCDEALRKLIKTRADLDAFTKDWGGGQINNPTWKEPDYDTQYLENNIRNILNRAVRDRRLDALGKKLGILSDAEQGRRANLESGEANEAANVLAKESNAIARDANRIAIESNDIAQQATKRANVSLAVAILSALAAAASAVF